jgi:NADH dehydrogenase
MRRPSEGASLRRLSAELETDPERRAELLSFVIVGGGPTGVELAGSIAELSHRTLADDFRHIDPASSRIHLVEAGSRVLAAFPDMLSQADSRKLTRLGVEVRTNSRVQEVDAEGVVIGGKRIRARNVIWAAGVVASPIGSWLGAETDRAGRVIVTGELSVPGHPEIFVVGDAAAVIQDGKSLPGVALVAMQQGRYVGKEIRRRIEGKKSTTFRYLDKGNLATVGRTYAVADIGAVKLRGWFAWVTWVVVHVYYLIGFRNRFLVLFQWAWAYSTWGRGARLIVEPDQRS